MYPQARELLRKVVLTVDRLPHRISVVGHTDSAPFANDRGYSNWELSADRANASRRALVELGLPAERIVRVGGRAEIEPLVPEDPLSPRNRRISITLLRRMPMPDPPLRADSQQAQRSEEHTSELQSLMRNTYTVSCSKKKTTNTTNNTR